MNKVIAVFDAFKMSESTVDYSIYLAKEFNAHIVATFLQDMAYHELLDSEETKHVTHSWEDVEVAIQKEEKLIASAVKKVEKRFDEAGIRYNVHKDKIIATQSLIRESYFCDLILINFNETFSNYDTSKPSRFLKDIIAKSDCPVMLVPDELKPIEKIVFAYDGTPSSTYAIRMFSYLFPSLRELELDAVMISDDKHGNHLPDYKLLKELLKKKFTIVEPSVIKSNYTIDALITYVQSQHKKSIVVLGAYQRSSISRWLHESTADSLITTVDVPLFIAHK